MVLRILRSQDVTGVGVDDACPTGGSVEGLNTEFKILRPHRPRIAPPQVVHVYVLPLVGDGLTGALPVVQCGTRDVNVVQHQVVLGFCPAGRQMTYVLSFPSMFSASIDPPRASTNLRVLGSPSPPVLREREGSARKRPVENARQVIGSYSRFHVRHCT